VAPATRLNARTATAAARLLPAIAAMLALAPLTACDKETPEDGRVRVTIRGETFRLEPAMDDPTRTRGLGGRESIDEDGGMIFVFRTSQRRYFHMKDCLVDIDIAYLDDTGRVVSIHEMEKVPPRREDETEREYIGRLEQYPSRYPCSIAIEVKGGTFADLGLEPGQVIDLDVEALKQRAE